MEVIVIGSKEIEDYKLVYEIVERYAKGSLDTVIVLDLPGTCSLAKLVGEELGSKVEVRSLVNDDFDRTYRELVEEFYDSRSCTFQVINMIGSEDIRLPSLEGLLRESGIHHKLYNIKVDNIKVLECSTAGDSRFSAFNAKVTLGPIRGTIEEIYQNAKISSKGEIAGKGRKFVYMECPITKQKYDIKEISTLYNVLWLLYFAQNKHLLDYVRQFDVFTDKFKAWYTINSQADVISNIVNDPDKLIDSLSESTWYENIRGLL